MITSPSYRVAVVEWIDEKGGLAQIIFDALFRLGHQPIYFKHDTTIPKDVDVVFSYAPYGRFLPIAQQVGRLPTSLRPTLVHWNTEGLPDLRLPWLMVMTLGAIRSWFGRIYGYSPSAAPPFADLLHRMENRVLRFRYVGDYHYAFRKGWLKVFADSSAIYAQIHRKHGLPTIVVPWGATPVWYENLQLQRDIDVLWMGQYGSRRRQRLLERIVAELISQGVNLHLADNIHNPFIFGENRTRYLNRSKITLNLTRTWYDDNFSRFSMAASNHSMIVSEPMLSHCPEYKPDIHYISTPIENITKTILYYLEYEAERNLMAERAYQLVTTDLSFEKGIKKIMDEVHIHRFAG